MLILCCRSLLRNEKAVSYLPYIHIPQGPRTVTADLATQPRLAVTRLMLTKLGTYA